MSREESCDFCGGNCGQCGSSHPGGPPSMARMASNLSRGSDVRDVRLTYKAPKPVDDAPPLLKKMKGNYLSFGLGIITGLALYELFKVAMT